MKGVTQVGAIHGVTLVVVIFLGYFSHAAPPLAVLARTRGTGMTGILVPSTGFYANCSCSFVSEVNLIQPPENLACVTSAAYASGGICMGKCNEEAAVCYRTGSVCSCGVV